MYDLQRIGKIISDIKKYFKELDGYNLKLKELDGYNLKLSDLYDSKNYNASSMLIFAILNRTVDLGGEIISTEDLGAPNSYRDVMVILAKAGVINKSQAGRMNNLIKKRNVFHIFMRIFQRRSCIRL